MDIIVPNVYLKFLSDNQQRIFDDGVLYDYEEILERYKTLEFAEYAKELIPIGNDNGDYELVMKASEEETCFAVLDMSTSELLKLASNLPCIISNKYYRAQAERRIKDNNLQDWVSYK